jgi:uncharacterized protein YdaU (DUF1376 family)
VIETYAPPAFQLYARDWLARSELLTLEQSGALMRLKSHAWLSAGHGLPPCSIPGDDATLARLSGLGPKWKKLGPPLKAMFQQDGDRLIDAELLAYRIDIEAKHHKRSTAGRIGNEKRWGEGSHSDSQTDRNAIANRSQNGRSADADASADASKSGTADAATAPLADAAAENGPLPAHAIAILARMPAAKRDDGRAQLLATLTGRGAPCRKATARVAYERRAPRLVLRAEAQQFEQRPPDKPGLEVLFVLYLVRDTYLEWKSTAEKRAGLPDSERKTGTAPTLPPAPLVYAQALEHAREWAADRPELTAEIEHVVTDRLGERAVNGRELQRGIDDETIERWRAAGSPTPTAAYSAGHDGPPSRSMP